MLDEEGFRRLLDRYHASEGEEQKRIGDELVAAIYEYFDRHLRPLLARSFPISAADTSARYSAMVNKFFTEILERRPDEFWRAQSLRVLTRFASVAISNDIRDVLRRQRTREVQAQDALVELAKQRAQHFRERHDLELECALKQLVAWDERPEPWPLRARVIRYRYSDGLDYPTIAALEQRDIKQIYRAKEEAILALRRACGRGTSTPGVGGAS